MSIGLIELPICIYLSIRFWDEFKVGMMIPMFLLYIWKECIPMSVCLHRYFSHKSFKCSRKVQFLLYLTACLASQKGPLWWASKHRRHHKYCDTKEDPHSPIAHSKMYAWLGWVYLPGKEQKIDAEYIKDLTKYRELVVMEYFYWIPVVIVHGGFWRYVGIGEAIFISMWSSVSCQLLTLYFNVLFHSKRIDSCKCNASDIPFDILSNIFGEAYHKIHHEKPSQLKRNGIDLPYYLFLSPLLKMKIITNTM